MSTQKKCPFCETNADIDSRENYYKISCPTCGRFLYKTPFFTNVDGKIKNEMAPYLYYKKIEQKSIPEDDAQDYQVVIKEELTEVEDVATPKEQLVTMREVQNFYPRTFNERIDRILVGFENNSSYVGEVFELSKDEFDSAIFAIRFDQNGIPLDSGEIDVQRRMIKGFLCEEKHYAEIVMGKSIKIGLTPTGWARIDELHRTNGDEKHIFVSMAFNDSTKETREAIRTGIIDAGYLADYIDEKIHNGQIVSEMFRLIRQCKLLVLEISDPNYGAYYEAGYALGLGKEVIICCKKEVFQQEYEIEGEKKIEKYLKPHFDIAQKQMLIWDDYEDLTHKLNEWIKAIA